MRLQSLLTVSLLTLVFAVPTRAQEAESTTATQDAAAAESKDWQEQIDEVFKTILDLAEAIPFYNIGPYIGISDAKPVVKDKDGNTIYATGPNGEALYITDENGKQELDEDGKPQLLPVYLLNKQNQPVQTTVPMVVLWLVIAAVFFTVRMGFVNVRLFRHSIDVVRARPPPLLGLPSRSPPARCAHRRLVCKRTEIRNV